MHSAQRVIDEIEHLVAHYHVRQIDIHDDNFSLDKPRAMEILGRLAKRRKKLFLNFQNGLSVDRMDEELLATMEEAGTFKLAFAVETADKDIQKDIRKVVDLDKAVRLIRRARSLGMVTCAHFILGLPGDTPETMERTIDYALAMDPHHAHFMICLPFPGTEIFDRVKEKGRLLVDVENGVDAGFFGEQVFFTLDGMDPREILRYFRHAIKRFYGRPAKIADVLRTIRSPQELRWLGSVLAGALLPLRRG
jgi:radical SAM superfamily enzyme YgiQ (UPF0313 family)